jgi:DNA-binding PucR family transcriptional regulator
VVDVLPEPPSWPAREERGEPGQLSALKGLLVLSALLLRQGDPELILHLVATAAPALAPCRTQGVVFDGRWSDVRTSEGKSTIFLDTLISKLQMPSQGGVLPLSGAVWGFAYPLLSWVGASGFLVVSAEVIPTRHEQFVLRALAQQGGVAVANAILHARERDHAAQLRQAILALERDAVIQQRLIRVAAAREGQEGIAQAVHDLSGCPTAIEDRDGHLRAWAGGARPDPYPRQSSERRRALLHEALAAAGPVRDGDRLFSVASTGADIMGVVVLLDPEHRAGEPEQVLLGYASMMLAIELAYLRSQQVTDLELRGELVLELLAGDDEISAQNRAQALGYDLERPHWVVLVESHQETESLLGAVRRVARDAGVGSLLAARPGGVVLLADEEWDWDQFYSMLSAEMHVTDCRVGVGGRCDSYGDFSRSLREAAQALKLQGAIDDQRGLTVFGDLGIYQLFCDLPDRGSLEQLVQRWLGALLDCDVNSGSQLVATLSAYLESGGNYQAAAQALSVHRSTVKYRLGRIRDVSGLDLSDADTHFHLHLATRAWRVRNALHTP